MAEHRITTTSTSPAPRRRFRFIAAVGVIGASGLLLGALGVPVSAGSGTAGGDVQASAEVEDGCASATAGTGDLVQVDTAGIQATGSGTVTVSGCRDDLDGVIPGEPGDSEPGDDIDLGDLEDIFDGDPGNGGGEDDLLDTEVLGSVIGALEDGIGGGSDPGDGDLGGLDDLLGEFPGGESPGGESPGGLDGLVPDLGTGPTGLLERLVQIVPGVIGGAAPGGDNGSGGGAGNGGPAVNAAAGGSVTGAGAGAGAEATGGAAAEMVLGADLGRDVPMPLGAGAGAGATLPRTGGGLGQGVLALVALLGAGRAAVAMVNRRWPAARCEAS